ncbi:HNH endonuclease [Candidatus Pacearchaeota archaeon]|nr:HNH endonuclease [Candidatus Pacearchaeota archaeon]
MRGELRIKILEILKTYKSFPTKQVYVKYNLLNDLLKETSYLDSSCTTTERVYNLIYNLYSIPVCKNYNCTNKVKFNSYVKGYREFCSPKCSHGSSHKIQTRSICSYGCGQPANFELGKKICCSSHYSKCLAIRKKNSEKNAGKNNAMYGKVNPKVFSIKDWKEKYPFFCKVEKMKEVDNKILVRCKYCKTWFEPSKETFRSRRDALEKPEGNGGNYFYCSDKCKNSCILFGLRTDYATKTNHSFTITDNEKSVWRHEVLKRQKDLSGYNYCEYCGKKRETKNLDAHHEKPLKLFPHLALDPDNGIILCGKGTANKCHYKIGHNGKCNLHQIAIKSCKNLGI